MTMGKTVVADFRSDTLTRPTEVMYKAMCSAPVGDDVLGEDPTVRELERTAAEMIGKEDAMFVPSGTASNLCAIIQHCADDRFAEMIVGDQQHTYLYEGGNVSRLAGVHSWILPNQPDGTLILGDIAKSIRIDDVHYPKTKLVALENTHNSCGGQPLDAEYVDAVGSITASRDVRLHIDGARIFNAATALSTSAKRLCQNADSVSVCLSKGLGSPAGSVLVGKSEFIRGARYVRKALGGGMRQAGVLAACGLVSLREMTLRLEEDHANAKRLAEGINSLSGLSVDSSKVKTNILFFDVVDGRGEELTNALKRDHGVLIGAYSTTKVRMVTHFDVTSSHVNHVLDAFKQVVDKLGIR